MTAHFHPTQILLKDLVALRKKADLFLLPETGKKAFTGSGNTFSPFKSRGLDFQEVRVYQPGDDIRQIDWHVTAKYGKPFTKLYTEEKERTVFFVVDLRSSMFFATHGAFKAVIAARLTAFMAFIAEHQHDKIGSLLLTDNGLLTSGDCDTNTLMPLLNQMSNPDKFKATAGGLDKAIRLLGQMIPAGSFVFFFSDFHDFTEQHLILLSRFSEKNTFLFCSIYDQLEANLPQDTLPFSDGKSNLVVSALNDKMRQKFHAQWQNQQAVIQKAAKKYGWGYLPIPTDSDYLNELIRFCFGKGGVHG